MEIEKNALACARFVQLVRDFSVQVQLYQEAIRYQTKPDEKRDLTLVSQRVYGRRDEFLTIFAAAGLSSFDEPLQEQILVLPTNAQLQILKKKSGYQV